MQRGEFVAQRHDALEQTRRSVERVSCGERRTREITRGSHDKAEA